MKGITKRIPKFRRLGKKAAMTEVNNASKYKKVIPLLTDHKGKETPFSLDWIKRRNWLLAEVLEGVNV